MYVFAYISLAITVFVIWFMPKRLSRQEIYVTWGIMATLALSVDLIFGMVYDLYDFVTKDIPVKDIFLQDALPPSFGVIFLNFMPKRRLHFIIYLFFVTVCSILYELLSIKFGYLIYKGWSIWYSVPFYFIGMLFLRWHLFFIRNR
ncbi:hypothetical protein ACFOU2_22075 [Bacillus songklensis]|uniref:Lycopene cyclase domain-containing protein n=1 Tax=Bacillus songklensis TaxID=1069116 RepID=A0ABV8B6S5_9BACI